MKVEVLIYSYLIICTAMIIFNIVCIFVFRHNDKKIDKYSKQFINRIIEQMKQDSINDSHIKYIYSKLKRINNLMAFDKTIAAMYEEYPEEAANYIEAISPVFVSLTSKYLKKNSIQSAYFPYIIKKYGLFKGQYNKIIIDSMMVLVRNQSLYCRENALNALYSIGLPEQVVNAFIALDESGCYHNSKLITDGLLTFSGNKNELADLFWDKLNSFSENIQIAIIDYFRFSSGEHCERIFKLLLSNNRSDEIAYSCIRYFSKYHYDPAYPYLVDYVENLNESKWEYSAIAASALAIYPCEKTFEVLKSMLFSRNWYVRYNASMSLERLGVEYSDLIDIFESDDRYASEIMRYRFDHKKMREKELKAANE